MIVLVFSIFCKSSSTKMMINLVCEKFFWRHTWSLASCLDTFLFAKNWWKLETTYFTVVEADFITSNEPVYSFEEFNDFMVFRNGGVGGPFDNSFFFNFPELFYLNLNILHGKIIVVRLQDSYICSIDNCLWIAL